MSTQATITCRGHPNIRATHTKTLELSTASEIGARATCVLGVDARFDVEELRQLRGTLTIELAAAGRHQRFVAEASPFYLGGDLVFRAGDGLRERTFASAASITAADVDRALVSALASSTTELTVTVTASGAASSGVLYVVAVPIGNDADITPRAVTVLGAVDTVLAEDTRRYRGLACAVGLVPSRVESHHASTSERAVDGVVARLLAGERMALVVDAGTPTWSDPGQDLVAAAVEAGVPVRPVPGASAVTAALAASGFPAHPFTFLGFPPRSRVPRHRLLAEVGARRHTVVLFESPRRVLATLDDVASVLPAWRVCLAREVTKIHEEFLRGTAGELVEELRERDAVLGECTIVLAPPPGELDVVEEATPATADVRAFVQQLAAQDVPVKTVAAALAKATGMSRNDAYATVLTWTS